MPYNIQWSFAKTSDLEYASLKRNRGDTCIFNVPRNKSKNCHIELSGVVVNSYGEQIDTVSQTFVVQQKTLKLNGYPVLEEFALHYLEGLN